MSAFSLRRLIGALAAGAALVTLLSLPGPSASALSARATGATEGKSAGNSRADRAAAPARPRVGQCRTMNSRQYAATTDPRPPISCRRTHQARTFLVPTVPRRISMRDRPAVLRFANRRCIAGREPVLGGTDRSRRLSAYDGGLWLPTPRQVSRGARWIRCDLVLIAGPRLAPLPPARRPQLGRTPHAESVARCALGRRTGYAVTTCSRPHAFRALGTYRMSGRSYPSDAARSREARRECGRIVPGDGYLVEYPSRAAFALDQRLAVCSTKE